MSGPDTTEFHQVSSEGICVLAVSGRVGVEKLAEFTAELKQLHARCDRVAVVDLMECPYFSSPVFPVLLRAHQEIEKAGGHLVVACASGLFDVLRTLKFDRLLELHMSLESCLASAIRHAQGA